MLALFAALLWRGKENQSVTEQRAISELGAKQNLEW